MERERCPKCASRGQDKSGDNLAVYPDGHKHCYACAYHEGVPIEERLQQLLPNISSMPNVDATFDFPKDYTTDIPITPLTWLKAYGITDKEIILHRFGWSQDRQMLVFPVLDGDGNLIMWQGRDFGEKDKQFKYITKGPASDVIHLVGLNVKTIIITEDLISAIKVGRRYQAMPVWGSNIPLKLIRRLSDRFSSLGVWLDRDKLHVALETVLRASQYMSTYLITSVFDPKAYTTDSIAEIVEEAMMAKISDNTFDNVKLHEVMGPIKNSA